MLDVSFTIQCKYSILLEEKLHSIFYIAQNCQDFILHNLLMSFKMTCVYICCAGEISIITISANFFTPVENLGNFEISNKPSPLCTREILENLKCDFSDDRDVDYN